MARLGHTTSGGCKVVTVLCSKFELIPGHYACGSSPRIRRSAVMLCYPIHSSLESLGPSHPVGHDWPALRRLYITASVLSLTQSHR